MDTLLNAVKQLCYLLGTFVTRG